MAQLQIYDGEAGKVKKGTFDETVFGDKVLMKTLREAVLMYEANLRQGNADTKGRNEVAGTNKKMYKQKHTGRARHSTMKVPNWRGGGVVGGPTPRDFGWAMPRKQLRVALRSALLGKLRDEEVSLLSRVKFAKPSSKQARAILSELKVDGSCCIVLEKPDDQLWKSFRNFPRLTVKMARELNAYDVCLHRRVLFTEEAIEELKNKVGGAAEPASEKPAAKKVAAKKEAKAPAKKAPVSKKKSKS